MDYLFLFFGFLLIFAGIVGSFLPVVPGPPTGWLGLLFLQLTDQVETNWNFLGITLGVALLVVLADYFIPALGAKKFGGTKYGIWGSTIGLIVGLLFTPVGMIFGLFLGALIGELIQDSRDFEKAFKASIGSVIGFFFSTTIKLIVGVVFLFYFLEQFWSVKTAFFSWW